jgi:hypothetical protein
VLRVIRYEQTVTPNLTAGTERLIEAVHKHQARLRSQPGSAGGSPCLLHRMMPASLVNAGLSGASPGSRGTDAG